MSLRRPTVARTVIYIPIWALYVGRPDARLRHCQFILPFEASLQTADRSSVILLGFREDYRPTSLLFPMHYYLNVWVRLLICSYASCLHLLYLMSELSCEYFHSTHLACWFGQMLTQAISWMKSLIVRPTPRGVPVSPVRSWILVTCILFASATHNKNPRASLRHSKSC